MPVFLSSTYSPPLWLRSGHGLTIWASVMRRVAPPRPFVRERLCTSDGDFIDVDRLFSAPGRGKIPRRSKKMLIISHGLEGHSRRHYVLGMASVFLEGGWDVAARNFRGCSGEINRTPGMYHGGETNDLHMVVSRYAEEGYQRMALVGFSMGGNQTLKYLGENATRVPGVVMAAVAISTPCDMVGSAHVLEKPSCALYMAYFMRSLREKMRQKHAMFPETIDISGLDQMHSFKAFDNAYTAPLYGFASARDYWQKSSSLQFLPHIRVPSLLLNAQDDPFLSATCYPKDLANNSTVFFLETPKHGGHVGFVPRHETSMYWSDRRAYDFVRAL